LTKQSDRTAMTDTEDLQVLREQQNLYDEDCEDDYLKHTNTTGDEYSVFYEFIKQIKPGMELWRLSVPAFILQPVSLLEKLSHYAAPNELSEHIHEIEKPDERFLQVLNWVLSNWRTIPRVGLESSKPYNPILGEIFKCYWTHENKDKSVFIAEQISHHPPVSAFYMNSKSRGNFTYHGWVYPQTTVSYYVASIMTGEFTVQFVPKGSQEPEVYDLKQPPVSCNGILYGSKYIEIYDTMTLTCAKTGFRAEVTFETGGTNALKGTVYKVDGDVTSDSSEREPIFTVEGVINEKVSATNVRSGETKVLYEVATLKRVPKYIAPVVDEEWNESRRVWHHLTKALKDSNFDDAQLHKHTVEERERARRKKMSDEYNKAQEEKKKHEEKKVEKKPEPEPQQSSWMGSLWSYGSSVVTAVVGGGSEEEKTEDKAHKFGHPGFTPKYFKEEGGENHWRYNGTPIEFADKTKA